MPLLREGKSVQEEVEEGFESEMGDQSGSGDSDDDFQVTFTVSLLSVDYVDRHCPLELHF